MRGLSLQIEVLEERIAPDLLDDTYLLDGANPVSAGSNPQPTNNEGTNPVPNGTNPVPNGGSEPSNT